MHACHCSQLFLLLLRVHGQPEFFAFVSAWQPATTHTLVSKPERFHDHRSHHRSHRPDFICASLAVLTQSFFLSNCILSLELVKTNFYIHPSVSVSHSSALTVPLRFSSLLYPSTDWRRWNGPFCCCQKARSNEIERSTLLSPGRKTLVLFRDIIAIIQNGSIKPADL